MKIKVWALVLIIIGSMFVGAATAFVGMSGVAMFALMIRNHAMGPQVTIQTPDYSYGNGGGQGGGGPAVPAVPTLPSDLPAGFNAGVNIESTYAAMTSRTVEQVQAAEQSAGTDAWGLANQEGKLNDLKSKVLDAVTASLKQMVADQKITQAQSDSYLNWVNQYLQTVGQDNTNGMMPGFRRGWQRQITPNATPDSATKS